MKRKAFNVLSAPKEDHSVNAYLALTSLMSIIRSEFPGLLSVF